MDISFSTHIPLVLIIVHINKEVNSYSHIFVYLLTEKSDKKFQIILLPIVVYEFYDTSIPKDL